MVHGIVAKALADALGAIATNLYWILDYTLVAVALALYAFRRPMVE